jgi:hypothetical protein
MVVQAYETQAIQEAIESGMARSELMLILGGLCVTDLISPYAGEPLADYVARATGELMVRYLAHNEDDTVPPLTGGP